MTVRTPLRLTHWRNTLAQHLANLALLIATDDYRNMVGGAIKYGLNAAARDTQEGREPPRPWWLNERTSEGYDAALQAHIRGEATSEEVSAADPYDDALRRMAERAARRKANS